MTKTREVMAYQTPSETDLPLFMATPDDASREVDVAGDEGDYESDYQDNVIGRMDVAASGDPSDFDALPSRIVDVDPEDADLMAIGAETKPSVFKSQPLPRALEESFPTFARALRQFKSIEERPRVLRIDSDETFGEVVADSAVREISRRVNELRQLLKEHLDEHSEERHPGYGRPPKQMSQWDEVMGAADAVKKITKATTADEAADAMPAVPIDLPEFARGKVRCWKDGNSIVCSIKFQAADGKGRTATMAARPKVDQTKVSGWALRSGVSPITILGVLDDLADVACAKKLVADVAGAALKAQRRLDVCGMGEGDGPVLLANPGSVGAPAQLAALMDVEQRADAGDAQAKKELGAIRKASETPTGKKIAPLLDESTKRLALAREEKAAQAGAGSFMSQYSQMGLVLG